MRFPTRRILPILILFSVFACKQVSFDEPQPAGKKSLSKIPKQLLGRYLTVTEDGLSKDTLVIEEHGYRIAYFDPEDRNKKPDRLDIGMVSDSLVLKSYKGYYFISIDEHPEWLVRVIKREKNGDLLLLSFDEGTNDDFDTYLLKLSEIARVDSTQLKDETLYQVHPTPKQLVTIIRKGLVSQTRLIRVSP